MPADDKLKAKALTQLAAIDREHRQILKKERLTQYGGDVLPDDYAEFNSLCLAAIDRITGRHDSRYEQALRELERHPLTAPELAGALYGLVRTIKRDIDAGSLISFREIEHAQLYSELLLLADWRLVQNHTRAAAALIGGVLETHLRQLAAKHDIPLATAKPGKAEPRTAPQQINNQLARVAYDQAEQQKVAAWLTSFANQSHSKATVIANAQEVRGFIARYPA